MTLLGANASGPLARLASALAADEQTRLRQAYPSVFEVNWRRRALMTAVAAAPVALLVFGFATLDVSWTKVFAGIGRLGQFAALMLPPTFSTLARLEAYLQGLAETLAIAFLGTAAAAVLAVPLGFLAARNVIANPVAHFLIRRCLDTIRSVDVLIWALIWINVVGLGPFAGILAILTSDVGALGKLFSEAIEAADARAVEAVRSSGGNRLHGLRFGLYPQVLPVFISQALYFFESNTRSATIIGIVGAGGIGLLFNDAIQQLEWQHVAFLSLMILVTVAVIDLISSKLRFAVIGRSALG